MPRSVFVIALGCVLLPAGLVWLPASRAADPGSRTESERDAPEAKPSSENEPLEPNADGKVVKPLKEWRKLLTRRQFEVTRLKGTEPAFNNAYWQTKKDGIYRCVCCRHELFDSKAKYDSGTGWPSFWQPIEKDAVEYHVDRTGGDVRLEVVCSRCDAHLGHVFADGPPPTGHRYCMNSAALKLAPRAQSKSPER